MPTHGIESIARRAAFSVSRRRSLVTLGGAALAAPLASPRLSGAKNRTRGKDCKKKEKQRCNSDIAACKGTVLLSCPDPAGCPAAQFCCEDCSASGFIACLIRAARS
jgi:hypothetical protein